MNSELIDNYLAYVQAAYLLYSFTG